MMDTATAIAVIRLAILGAAAFQRAAGRPITEEEFADLVATSQAANRLAVDRIRDAIEDSRARQARDEGDS